MLKTFCMILASSNVCRAKCAQKALAGPIMKQMICELSLLPVFVAKGSALTKYNKQDIAQQGIHDRKERALLVLALNIMRALYKTHRLLHMGPLR